jgi:hypothetical protein
MATLIHRLVGDTSISNELLAPGEISGAIRSISITNEASGGTISISIYDSELSVGAYLIRSVSIPAGATLILDDPGMLSFDKDRYGLYSIVLAGTIINLVINTK